MSHPVLNGVWCPSEAWGACPLVVGMFPWAAVTLNIVPCPVKAAQPQIRHCRGGMAARSQDEQLLCLVREAGVRAKKGDMGVWGRGGQR